MIKFGDGGIKLEQIAKKFDAKNEIFCYPNNKRKITQKTLNSKSFTDEKNAFITAKSDITTSIDNNTLIIETLICETPNSLIVTTELPKLYNDILDVNITSKRIAIKGEAKNQIETAKRNNNHPKRLNKKIFLPKTVVPGKAMAKFKNDTLMIMLPKADIEKVQKICYKIR